MPLDTLSLFNLNENIQSAEINPCLGLLIPLVNSVTYRVPTAKMKAMKRKLMKSTIDAIEPGGKDNICWDTEITGLALKTTPAGRKSFFYVYRTASGQQRKPKIGSYGTFTVKTARDVARKWAADIALGGDPRRDRQNKRAAPDVKALAEQYLKEHAIPHKKASSVAGARNCTVTTGSTPATYSTSRVPYSGEVTETKCVTLVVSISSRSC